MKNAQVLLLSGVPASGKDTISQWLVANSTHFELFKKHRAGCNKPNSSYINVSDELFQELTERGEFLQAHTRYTRSYGVGKENIKIALMQNKIPIIHTGRIENLVILKQSLEQEIGVKSVAVHLWEAKQVIEARLEARHAENSEISARLIALEEELSDFKNKKHLFSCIDYYIRNSNLEQTTQKIINVFHGQGIEPELQPHI